MIIVTSLFLCWMYSEKSGVISKMMTKQRHLENFGTYDVQNWGTRHVFTESIHNHYNHYWWARRRRPRNSLGKFWKRKRKSPNSKFHHLRSLNHWRVPKTTTNQSADSCIFRCQIQLYLWTRSSWCAYLVTYYTTYVVCFLQEPLKIILHGFLGIASRF